MDWQTIKLLLKIITPLEVIFYLAMMFYFKIFAIDKDNDI